MPQPLCIAIMGHRGVPAHFSGSETAVEEIGSRLADKGHEVVVYCRKHNSSTHEESYKGMKRVVLPSINTMELDMLSHTFLSIVHLCFYNAADVVHFHGVGNALFFPLLKLIGPRKKVVVVVDGPDWNRPKWGRLAKLMLRVSFPLAVRFADEIISDNEPVRQLFREKYGRETPLIGYGADLATPRTRDALAKYELEPGKYILQVAALVPDKGIHIAVQAYEKLDTDLPFVIVGDTPYMTKYKAQVQSTKDPRIRFLGYIYGLPYRELLAGCYLYVHPLIVDGTSPALLQAMAYGRCAVASNLPETTMTLGDGGPVFATGSADALRDLMAEMLANPEGVQEYGDKARKRIIAHYSWDSVTDAYEAVSYQVFSEGQRVASSRTDLN